MREGEFEVKQKPFVRVLGSSDWEPMPDNECAHYSINDRILVDTGWGTVRNLMNIGLDPMAFNTICLTHLHADHYMGLAQLLMYRRIKRGTLGDLTISGPIETLRAGIDRCIHYILHDSLRLDEEIREMPKIVEMGNNTSFTADEFCIESIKSDHTVPGLCYRITHLPSSHALGFSGDTMYRDEFGAFFCDCSLLIYEATFGGDANPAERTWHCRHSSAHDAARVAREANVSSLLLTHAQPFRQQEGVSTAQSQLSIPVAWAEPYGVYFF